MRIVPENLPEEGKRLTGALDVELEADEMADALVTREPVEFDIWAIRDGRALQVSGSLSAPVQVRCSRCAQDFALAVEREFELLYEPADVGSEEPHPELDESDLSLDYYEGQAVDVHELLAEQVLLALPMKVLCVDDCRGLCPKCGVNRNTTDCDCKRDVDPRLTSLEAIRDQL